EACRPRAPRCWSGAAGAGCFASPWAPRLASDVRGDGQQARPAALAEPGEGPAAAPAWLAGGAAACALAVALTARPRRRAGTAVSRAVLKQLSRSGQLVKGIVAQAVTISGVVGGEAEKNANGEFVQAATLYNGKRHWQKKDDAEVWLLYIKNRWWVTDTADKDAEASSGWVCSETTEKRYPFDVTTWEAYVNDEWVVQSSISVADSEAEPAAAGEAASSDDGLVTTTLPDGTVRFKAKATTDGSVVTAVPDGTVRSKAGANAEAGGAAPRRVSARRRRRLWQPSPASSPAAAWASASASALSASPSPSPCSSASAHRRRRRRGRLIQA
ncbi:unnamed protein product, partial [Prorocentrum cordatum]